MKPLTEREREVLRWVSKGYSDTQIGWHLNITKSTVHHHLVTINRKLGTRTRQDAAAKGLADEA